MIDIDCKISYSNVVKVNIQNLNDVMIGNTIFTANITINHLASNADYQIQLLDGVGKAMANKEILKTTNK
jgi:hypothetical protein